jgi:hypothetical protein
MMLFISIPSNTLKSLEKLSFLFLVFIYFRWYFLHWFLVHWYLDLLKVQSYYNLSFHLSWFIYFYHSDFLIFGMASLSPNQFLSFFCFSFWIHLKIYRKLRPYQSILQDHRPQLSSLSWMKILPLKKKISSEK